MTNPSFQSFTCLCGYKFPDIMVAFQREEPVDVTITVACSGCTKVYSQIVRSQFIS